MPKTKRYVALLRGINVGKAKRVSMSDLRAVFESLGFSAVSTLLNSGNVVFDSSRLVRAAAIEKALVDATGIAARVTVLDADEVAEIVARNPLSKIATDPSRHLVSVLNDARDAAALKPLLQTDWSPEAIALGSRVAYLWCPAGILESRLQKELDRRLRDAVTTRNWATFARIAAAVSR